MCSGCHWHLESHRHESAWKMDNFRNLFLGMFAKQPRILKDCQRNQFHWRVSYIRGLDFGGILGLLRSLGKVFFNEKSKCWLSSADSVDSQKIGGVASIELSDIPAGSAISRVCYIYKAWVPDTTNSQNLSKRQLMNILNIFFSVSCTAEHTAYM